MPIYEEMVIEKKTGKKVPKMIDGKKQYYIRTYIEDENGYSKQITRHNKRWLGNPGKKLAIQEEGRLTAGDILKKKQEKNITVIELRDKYLEFRKPQVDEDSLKSIETKLNHFCIIDKTKQVETKPNLNIRKYTKEMFNDWKEQMKNKLYASVNMKEEYSLEWKKSERKYKWQLYSIKYLNTVYNELCSMIDYGISEGYCSYNFVKQAGKIGTAKEIKLSNKKDEYVILSFNEFERLLEVSKNDLKYNTIFDLFYKKGPRPGEIRAFQCWTHDYENNRLKVDKTMSKNNVLKEPKTPTSKDWIEDLDDDLNEKIHQVILNLQKQSNYNDNWFIFGGEKPISSHAMNHNKDKYFKLANINKKGFRLHDFRHSCASWLHSIGIDIAVISKILRHSNIAITMETYMHLFEEDYKKAIEKINDYLDKTKNKTKGI